MTMKELFKDEPIAAILVSLTLACVLFISACTIGSMMDYRHAVDIHNRYCVNTSYHWVFVTNSSCVLDYDLNEG